MGATEFADGDGRCDAYIQTFAFSPFAWHGWNVNPLVDVFGNLGADSLSLVAKDDERPNLKSKFKRKPTFRDRSNH